MVRVFAHHITASSVASLFRTRLPDYDHFSVSLFARMQDVQIFVTASSKEKPANNDISLPEQVMRSYLKFLSPCSWSFDDPFCPLILLPAHACRRSRHDTTIQAYERNDTTSVVRNVMLYLRGPENHRSMNPIVDDPARPSLLGQPRQILLRDATFMVVELRYNIQQ